MNSSSAVAHEVPITLKANDYIAHAKFDLYGGCEVELLISDEFATSFGFDYLDADHFKPYSADVAGGGDSDFRVYQGIVEVSFNTGEGSIRTARCANVLVGGSDNLMGLPTISRLCLGVDASGTICIFPVRAAKIL